MKKFIKPLLLLLLTVGCCCVKSQNLEVGWTGSIGMSKVTSNLPISGDYKTKYAFSGNLGMFLEKIIGQKSRLGIEALWVQIEGKETTGQHILTATGPQGIEVVGFSTDKSTIHSSYIGIPVYYRYAFGNFGIKGGVQPMIFLFARAKDESKGEINNSPFETRSETEDLNFGRVDIGPKIGIDYGLNKKLRVRADYYHGLTDITADEFPWQRRNRQISLGLNYIF